MAKRNSKQKGNRFELAVAKDFSERFNDKFTRVPQSGAIVGGLNRIKMNTLREDAQEILAGDIICPRWFPFSVELKNYAPENAPNMYTLLENDSALLDEWISQARQDAHFAHKEWFLMFNITRRSCFVCVDYKKFVEHCVKSFDDMPKKFIMYKNSIIIDREIFINSYIYSYFPPEKKVQNLDG